VADSEAGAADTDMLCGSTSYLSMLHDDERNSAYQRGLEAALQRCEPGALVLDVGAGLGLLSILACKYAICLIRLPKGCRESRLGPQSRQQLQSRWLRNIGACSRHCRAGSRRSRMAASLMRHFANAMWQIAVQNGVSDRIRIVRAAASEVGCAPLPPTRGRGRTVEASRFGQRSRPPCADAFDVRVAQPAGRRVLGSAA
jgi:hypothetical protein